MRNIKPIDYSIKAKGHTAQYRMHKYFARRPYNVFNNLIKHYSHKGDTILDCFVGGGVTLFEGISLERNVIGVDINPLASFITRMQVFTGDLEKMESVFTNFFNEINAKYNDYYKVEFSNDSGICEWVEWAYVVLCPKCQGKIVLSEENKVRNGVYSCKNKECENNQGVRRVDTLPYDSVPLKVKYKSDKTGKEIIRNVDNNTKLFDGSLLEEKLEELKYKPNFKIPMDWDRQHEDKLKEKGIIEYRDLFTNRNYIINCLVFNDLKNKEHEISEYYYERLYFLFSSSLRYTNNMTRVTANWENGNPTSMDKHAYWLPNQYVETNIVHIIKKRMRSILNGFKYSQEQLPPETKEVSDFNDLGATSNYLVLNQSSAELPIPDKSIDVIITDPPYGSNVQYAELSTVWNAWFKYFKDLPNYIYKDEEAVVNRKTKVAGAKTETDYEELLYNVYAECYRLLKDDGYLVFTFNNKNIKVWIAMLKSVARAGFYLPENGVVFQDFVQAYKNTSHLRFAGNVQGDFIYSFIKGTRPLVPEMEKISFEDLIYKSIDECIEDIFKDTSKCSTPDLYQVIFSKLSSVIMSYITSNINNNEALRFEHFTNDFVDIILKEKLDFVNSTWQLKEK